MDFGEFLEEIPSALIAAEASANACFDPSGIIECRALTRVFSGGKIGKNVLEKSGTDGRITMIIVGHKNFLAWTMGCKRDRSKKAEIFTFLPWESDFNLVKTTV